MLLVLAPKTTAPEPALSTVTVRVPTPLLASGVGDHAGSGLSAGASVTRITGSTVSSNNTISNVGPGNSGTMSLYKLTETLPAVVDLQDNSNGLGKAIPAGVKNMWVKVTATGQDPVITGSFYTCGVYFP